MQEQEGPDFRARGTGTANYRKAVIHLRTSIAFAKQTQNQNQSQLPSPLGQEQRIAVVSPLKAH
jgi:hypothetical protein